MKEIYKKITSNGLKKKFLLMFLLVFAVILSGCSIKKGASTSELEQARLKAEAFINDNFMQEGQKVTVSDIKLESDLYKFKVNLVGGQSIDSYMTKDGSKLFESAIDMTDTSTEVNNETPSAVAPKNDKPIVELFTMSHCPYGTQIEKGIIPVVETLKDKIDFSIKFCDYAMHGEIELKEQLKQYCISKEQPDKYISYLKCFLISGDSNACSASAKLSSLDSCISKTDTEFSVMKNFNDKSTWMGNYPTFNVFAKENTQYGVQGSPTLIINGTIVESARDSKSLLATICSAFNNPPEECNTGLSSATPAPGFGDETTNASTDASCE